MYLLNKRNQPDLSVAWMTKISFQVLVSSTYHIPTQAPFITHHRSGRHPVWHFCFPQHRFWRFGSSRLIHWVAASLIHDVSKECTAFFDPWIVRQYIRSKHWQFVALLLSMTNSANIFEALHVTVRFTSRDV